jgi:hypothetical protein
MKDKTVKIVVNGWCEEGEAPDNIFINCPRCGKHLHKTDALKLCNLLVVYCNGFLPNKEGYKVLPCLFMEIYSM